MLCVLITFGVFGYVIGMHPNVGLDEYQIMDKYGYPYERHYVTTEDGYILEVSRVLPRSPKAYLNTTVAFKVYPELKAKSPGEPVLLMHGLMSSGRAFVSHDAEKALAFILVNHGYDVYMGNARGATRSRKHVTLDPDLNAKEFFDYSWHEIGVLDQPAMIDYILSLTGFKQVSFVGHSQGGTTLLSMTAGRPEVNSKIKIGFSFGGPGVMRYTPNVLVKRFCDYEKDIQAMTQRLEIYEFIKYAPFFLDLAKIMADAQFGLREILTQAMNTINVITAHNMNVDIMPVLASSSPSGASWNQVFHYMQCVRNGDFRLYDYIEKGKNFQKYGSHIPPRYNLTEITCPTVIYYSKDDFYLREKDALLMANSMKHGIPVEIKVPKFSHSDYMWAENVVNYVYKDLLWRLRNI